MSCARRCALEGVWRGGRRVSYRGAHAAALLGAREASPARPWPSRPTRTMRARRRRGSAGASASGSRRRARGAGRSRVLRASSSPSSPSGGTTARVSLRGRLAARATSSASRTPARRRAISSRSSRGRVGACAVGSEEPRAGRVRSPVLHAGAAPSTSRPDHDARLAAASRLLRLLAERAASPTLSCPSCQPARPPVRRWSRVGALASGSDEPRAGRPAPRVRRASAALSSISYWFTTRAATRAPA